MTNVFKIADILVEHALRAHPGQIAIIAYYGSHATGSASPTSDLDIFYIPDEGQASSLNCEFILGGLPFDFWGVPWKFAEDIANARSRRPWAVSASLIANTQVLYHRSPEDLDRFNALKARIEELTKPASRPIMVARALDEFQTTLFQLGQMRLAQAEGDLAGMYWAGWQFVSRAANCLALVNQTYFSKGWGANWPQILAMPLKPQGLEQIMRNILTPQGADSMLAEADKLAKEVRSILLEAQASLAEPAAPKKVFDYFYYYVVEYKHKVLSACQRQDTLAAGSAAFHLQELLCQIMNKVERGFYGSAFNLLGEYTGGYERAGFPDLLTPASQGNLDELAQQTRLLDEKVRQWFESHSVELGILESEDELRLFLKQIDPIP
jgi:hypothetical protein